MDKHPLDSLSTLLGRASTGKKCCLPVLVAKWCVQSGKVPGKIPCLHTSVDTRSIQISQCVSEIEYVTQSHLVPFSPRHIGCCGPAVLAALMCVEATVPNQIMSSNAKRQPGKSKSRTKTRLCCCALCACVEINGCGGGDWIMTQGGGCSITVQWVLSRLKGPSRT